ncbi:probable plastid-lipid-associated protein 13, chloroplastic [Phragmites australis]|uniref:probable plastid-lipid-associated protein 13, chloroplastic n=1 Tax=Phragmites australis TaxID=29695 RepID=UPI002D7A057E|nr:probable plastid-lipid-associated protein 13, chloroplastic [Phragmites australis]
MAAAAAALTPASPPLLPYPRGRRDGLLRLSSRRPAAGRFRAAAQTFQGPPAASYAREMERLSAKESLLLAFKDAGGFEALVSGKTTEMQRIDVNERIVGLERLNPTPRPTTSPFLEGRWNFEWFGDSSPGAFAARLLFERSPTTVAHFMGLDLLIKDGYSKLSSNIMFLNTIQSKFLLTTQLSVEGPIRMKEEYVEGLIEIPKISEETLPEQLKGLLGQTAGALQQLPSPIRDAVAEGLKLPLSGTFQRLFMISYLDEEILIIRDAAGAPDVLTRLEGPQPNPIDGSADAVISEYES